MAAATQTCEQEKKKTQMTKLNSILRSINAKIYYFVPFLAACCYIKNCSCSQKKTRHHSYRKEDCAMRPINGCPENFQSPHYAPGYCSRNFNGLLF